MADTSPYPKEGDPAPTFTLVADNGEKVSLSDFQGSKVVLYFYPRDDTPGCTKESCEFRDALADFERKDTIILGVSRDDTASHVRFKEKFRLNFPLLSDVDGKACEAYGVWQEKSLYGKKSMGIVRTTFVIDENGKVAKVFPKVKPEGHAAEVLAALESRGGSSSSGSS